MRQNTISVLYTFDLTLDLAYIANSGTSDAINKSCVNTDSLSYIFISCIILGLLNPDLIPETDIA